MTTKLVLHISSDKGEPGLSNAIYVEETFDEVMGKLMPINPPSSTEGHQLNYTYNKADGSGRVMVSPNAIVVVSENEAWDD